MGNTFESLGLKSENSGCFNGQWLPATAGDRIAINSPIDLSPLGSVISCSEEQYELTIKSSVETFEKWRLLPAPKRGELVRQIGQELRTHKAALGTLISLETGKLLSEGLGEVQEAIDIADFACGLSRQLYGNTMHSERPLHRMYEQWHPLGVVGVITAFNFPLAVWAWNACIAAVCGDTVVWKPSELTPLTAVAMTKICERVCQAEGLPGVFSLVVGQGKELGERLANDRRVPLISATGSTEMGRLVGTAVSRRLGRSLLELGGNNAVIIESDANLELAVRAVTFGAVGTAGQRCTSIRRILLQKDISEEFSKRLLAAYKKIKIGDPLKPDVLMGPLINAKAVSNFHTAVSRAKAEGAKLLCGGQSAASQPSPYYVEPTIFAADKSLSLLQEETFAPISYLLTFDTLDEAIQINNSVSQGLSSAIFTNSLEKAEVFLSARGSDCGIANVNIGTSGAEIGGAFGGEKDSGGGREAGSDAWKAYMRRQTNTINFGKALPLAQGISFSYGADE